HAQHGCLLAESDVLPLASAVFPYTTLFRSLFEPVGETWPRERALLDERAPFAVCTVLPGSGEQGAGSRLIVTPDDAEGDLGSPALTAGAVACARDLLGSDDSGIHELAGHEVFIDVFEPPPQPVIL